MSVGHLRDGDGDLLLGIIEDARRNPMGEQVSWVLLEGLQRLIPCDWDVSFQHHDYRRMQTLLIQYVDEDAVHMTLDREAANEDGELFWQLWWRGPCSWPQRTGDLRTVTSSTDFFPTERERLADPLREYNPEVSFGLSVSLPALPGEARRFEFRRASGPAFTERDRQLLVLLRPHLVELCPLSARSGPVAPLTPREAEVLGMAAAGLSYSEIARELFVSVATVRKHMEHVRARLGVHSVTAAAAVALPQQNGSVTA